MAHFAEINQTNTVVQVIVVHNNELLEDGFESEAKGIKFCQSILGGYWVQTSYNASIRKNYAGIGYTYDADLDAFIPPKPFASWILNEETCQWQPPIAYTNDENHYNWNEETLSWILQSTD